MEVDRAAGAQAIRAGVMVVRAAGAESIGAVRTETMGTAAARVGTRMAAAVRAEVWAVMTTVKAVMAEVAAEKVAAVKEAMVPAALAEAVLAVAGVMMVHEYEAERTGTLRAMAEEVELHG